MTPEEIAAHKREHYNAQVVYLRKKNPDLMILRVKPDFPRPIHKPGQYCTLGLGFWEPRCIRAASPKRLPNFQGEPIGSPGLFVELFGAG